jgi:tRNA A-37 threonylcarbamoyl transferase component Bud32
MSEVLMGMDPEDPKNYLYLRTTEGLVSLNERASLWEIVSELRPGKQVTISPLAGVLNEVYLVTVGNERFVAKRFTDWHGFKWFTLNLVSLGSKLFVVSGKERMNNEYGINRYLVRKGVKAPQIIHAWVKDRLMLKSFVSGESLAHYAAQVSVQSSLTKSQYRISEHLGETVAKVHDVGVSIGDSKPENFVALGDDIYVIDLEQAGKRGEYAWDLAELLFYAGHYSMSPTPSRGLVEAVQAFIRGYLRNGDPDDLRKAAGLRYSKVFSLWTPAPIIMEISQQLRKAA